MSKEKVQNKIGTEPQKVSPQKLVYVGPSLPGLKTFTSFKGGLPQEGKTLISRDERYKRLFIPVSGFIKALKDIQADGGLYEIYKNATKERF